MNSLDYALQISISIAISLIVIHVLSFIISKLKNRKNRLLNPSEYFPEEEVKSLKQLYYLALILLLVFSIANFFFDNNIILSNSPEFYVFNSVLDIAVSLYIATILYRESWKKNLILIIFLLPIPSISFLIFGESMIEYWDFMRIPVFLYLIKHLYHKFKSFTDENKLGISIILLFTIIFLSFIFTMGFENRDPLDSLVMVSNAFTSNGYAILGETPGGKINSIILVWSGYIISGAATASLTAAIMIRHNRHKENEYNEKIDNMQSSIDEILERLDEKD